MMQTKAVPVRKGPSQAQLPEWYTKEIDPVGDL